MKLCVIKDFVPKTMFLPKKQKIMLECDHCHLWQHAACYRIQDQDQVPALHCCRACSQRGIGACTDPKQARLVEKSRGN